MYYLSRTASDSDRHPVSTYIKSDAHAEFNVHVHLTLYYKIIILESILCQSMTS